MSKTEWHSMDGNAAAAYSAHAMSEVIAIYPITPSSPMAESADEYSAAGRKNIFGTVPTVYEMQSEGGAVAAIHGAMSAGALTTTFTASQGLLLMIPSMYKIAGELLPTVFNVTARTLSMHALSIFGDHSDVMACRQTGFAMLASNNQQETMDQAAIAMAASIRSSIPFLHFFDGFRSSHEISKVKNIPIETLRALVDDDALAAFRARSLHPDHPVLKGTAMNPDIWFQGAEARNPHYDALPGHLEAVYERFGQLTGRRYRFFEYVGHPEADTLFVAMGSGAEVVEEAVAWLNQNRGTRLGLLKVRLYRPFAAAAFLDALPATTKRMVVLDRTKEPGAHGEPLFQDVVSALAEGLRLGRLAAMPKAVGGRYGLSSKDFTPSHVKAILDHLDSTPAEKWIHGFTVGIEDDVSKRSLPVRETIDTETKGVHRLKFWGLGSDGTVGANKNSIKIIGDNSDMFVQGHFVYDSKKAGGTTISHLRFSPSPILSHYLVTEPDFVAIHNREFLGKFELLAGLQKGGMVLLNTDVKPEEVFSTFPEREQKVLIERRARLFAIDANRIVAELGMPGRTNTTMQAAFFKITQILPDEVVTKEIEGAIHKTYGKKGEKVVTLNIEAFRRGMNAFYEVPVPEAPFQPAPAAKPITPHAGDEAIAPILTRIIDPVARLEGDAIPVSAIPPDGVFPTATTRYEKRSIATHVPKWDHTLCIQCGQCAFVCPHAAIRNRLHDQSLIRLGEAEFPTLPVKGVKGAENHRFRVQVLPDDCTGCGVCVETCLGKEKEPAADAPAPGGKPAKPRKALAMVPKKTLLDDLRRSEAEFLRLPPTDRALVNAKLVKGTQLLDPLFEFSGACPGCGETPYIKLFTQLAGERIIQSNATGCSSIYGGTAPTVPYCKNEKGRGPAWASSLFEDNAEHGFGIRLGVEYLQKEAFALKDALLADPGTDGTVKALLERVRPIAEQGDDKVWQEVKGVTDELAALLKDAPAGTPLARLGKVARYLSDTVVLIVGGDGWAYDIGYGGLDHVLASGRPVKILVLDTEVYSNTGGQLSKSTFMGGVAKFAAAGKESHKKDLGMMAMNYKNVYVASINFSADMNQTVRAVREALEYPGTALIIGYSTCIEHGIAMNKGPAFGKLAVDCGYWLLYRYDPRRLNEGKNPLQLDSKEPTKPLREYLTGERRFARLLDERPDRAERMFTEAERFVKNRHGYYKKLAEMSFEDWQKPVG